MASEAIRGVGVEGAEEVALIVAGEEGGEASEVAEEAVEVGSFFAATLLNT